MTEYGGNGGLFATMIKWLVIGFLAIVAFRVGMAVLGMAFKLGLFLLFTLGPIILIGWLVLKLMRYISRPNHSVA